MACVCGAKVTYKADVGSNLHSDWCDDSAIVIAQKKAAKPKLTCYGGMLYGSVHAVPTVTIEYPNDPALGMYSGTIKHFCDHCCPVSSIMSLNKQGCTIKKAGTDEILRP